VRARGERASARVRGERAERAECSRGRRRDGWAAESETRPQTDVQNSGSMGGDRA
jgi:hypothetical protein